MLEGLNLKKEKKLEFPKSLAVNISILSKNGNEITSVDKKKFNFMINQWKQSKIGKIKIGKNKSNHITINSKEVSNEHGVLDFIISDNDVLNFYYKNLSKHGSVVDGKVLNSNGIYLDKYSVISLGNLNSGKHYELRFDYELR